MDRPLKARSRTAIWSEGSAWRIPQVDDAAGAVRSVMVELEIQGNAADGYHLCMAPEGCSAADYWYQTKAEALEAALELFGVDQQAWE